FEHSGENLEYAGQQCCGQQILESMRLDQRDHDERHGSGGGGNHAGASAGKGDHDCNAEGRVEADLRVDPGNDGKGDCFRNECKRHDQACEQIAPHVGEPLLINILTKHGGYEVSIKRDTVAHPGTAHVDASLYRRLRWGPLVSPQHVEQELVAMPCRFLLGRYLHAARAPWLLGLMMLYAVLSLWPAGAAQAQAAASCNNGQPVRFADQNWESANFMTHVYIRVLNDVFGCATEIVPGTPAAAEAALSQ